MRRQFSLFCSWLRSVWQLSLIHILGISCTLLTGSMTAAQKRAALAAIETGAAQVVVGTHALIQQGVQFHPVSYTHLLYTDAPRERIESYER